MNTKRMCSLLAALAMCLPASAMAQMVGSGVVSLAGPGAGASEDFNSLATSGTSDILPQGWYFRKFRASGTLDLGTYATGNGSDSGGNVYSYGASGNTDRAFGILAANAMAPVNNVVGHLGAQLQNNSGSTLSELQISYVGETWRRRSTTASPDRLRFQYSINATSLDTGTWTDVPSLDFVTPDSATDTNNGNASTNRSEISGTVTGLAINNGGNFWIRWGDTNISGEDDGLAIDDIVFGTPTDIAPFLADSLPADGATDFPTNASLILTFSEPVDVSGTWFEIQCNASGYYNPANTTVSGGPGVYYLTPNTPLLPDDDCELTLDTQLIVDQGPSAFELDDPGVIAFGTIAPPPNQAPELSSTVPLQGANNFPSAGDLRAVFNEAVTVSPGAFTLTCDASTGISLSTSTSDGGITWVIATGTALLPGDACSFGIHRDFIEDLEGALLVEGATISFTVADFGNVGAYYENVNLASPELLRCSLYETIKGHTRIPYSGAGTNTWTVLNLADEDPVDTSKILDVYKNESITKISGGEGAYNREHTWPRSYGLGQTSTPGPATDTHMLHLTEVNYNTQRGNRPFGICASGCTKLATTPNHGIGGNSDADSNWVKAPDGADGTFEPWNHIKGNMARAVMYMAIRYNGEGDEPDLELTNNRALYRTRPNTSAPPSGTYYMGDLSAVLAWNTFDPPTARELERNQIVYSFQNNRNPFVDHPTWARAELFAATRATPCLLNQHAPVANPDSYTVAQAGTLTTTAANGVLDNDTDVEFDAAGSVPAGWFTLTAERLSDPVNGTLALSANGSFTYTPNASFCGTDSFTYRTSDGVRWSAPATASIAVGVDCEGEPQPTNIFADGFEMQD